jgi:NitT/TauT family transport system substrate-binding protein
MAYLTAEVALAMGYYQQEGLDVDVLPDSAQTTQAVLDGQADIAGASTPQVLNAMQAGRPVTAVGVLTPNSPNDLALSNKAIKDLAAKGVTPTSSIADRLKALKGMTITLPAEGSTSNLTFRAMLTEVGLNPDSDVKLVAISDSQANVTTTREGRADGYVFSPPVTTVAQADGFGQRWLAFYEDPSMAGVYTILIIVSPDYLKQHADTVEAFLRATDKAFQALQDDKAAAAKAVKAKWFADLDQKTFDLAFDAMVPVYADGMYPVPSNVSRMVQLTSQQTGQDLSDLTFDKIFDVSALKAAGIH